jgi:hypothetical protein
MKRYNEVFSAILLVHSIYARFQACLATACYKFHKYLHTAKLQPANSQKTPLSFICFAAKKLFMLRQA